MSFQVFDMILKILERQNFGVSVHKTRLTIILKINKESKLLFLLKRVGYTQKLQKKVLNGGKAQIQVSDKSPFIVRYHSNSQRASVTFSYSVRNKHGVLISRKI